MKEFLATPTGRYIIIGMIALMLITATYFIFFNKDDDQKAIDDAINKNILSYDRSQYYQFADEIESATNTAADDEEAIYRVFRFLRNDSDYLMLVKAFGKRSYMYGFVGWAFNASLSEVLSEKLDIDELDTINKILEESNITHRI